MKTTLLRIMLTCQLVSLPVVSGSAVTPEYSVAINGSYPLDYREIPQIQRLVTAAGICLPIGSITMHSAGRATLDCGPIDAHPKKGRDLGHWIQVTVFRKHGRWYIDRDSIRMTERRWAM